MTFTYNRLGHTLSTTDFMERTTTITYDHQGLLTSTTDAVGTLSYAYNAADAAILANFGDILPNY